MNNLTKIIFLGVLAILFFACSAKKGKDAFKYTIDKFDDIKIMRYQIPGWESLSLQQKNLLYYLSEAALCGRDILWDQNFKYNLKIRRVLEGILASEIADKNSADYQEFLTYWKKIFFSNGIHHHYSNDKFTPGFSFEYFAELVENADVSAALDENESKEDLLKLLKPILFDPSVYAKKINLDRSQGLVEASAVNFYEGVTTTEVETFYAKMTKSDDPQPISYGLNSKLVKENGKVLEKTWKIGGMYAPAIEQIVFNLERAIEFAENEQQKAHLQKLIEYYQTGDLKTWDEYNVLWAADNESTIDYVNGFIETYGDPFGMKATWESVINFKDIKASERTEKISSHAQWFEDHSPIDPKFKKEEVKGVTAKVITVVQLGGDCYPHTPIGINLPNADWIRRDYGSKSVTLENITYAYDKSAEEGPSMLSEFAYDAEEIELSKTHGSLANNLHTDLHECLGHGSGKLLPGTSSEALKNYSSALEEVRADLFALYYMMDQKMIELNLMTTLDVAKAEYNSYIRNGLMTQLVRITPGKNIEQAHMRCRSLISHWVYEHGKAENVIEKITKENKTYFKIHDYEKLRQLFAALLSEVQRIKSEGDYEVGKNLVETYAVKVDAALHAEVLERYRKLDLAPYGGFINPELNLIQENGVTKDVKVIYDNDYLKQMLYYGKAYSFLPNVN